ncbi:MAG: hypothetical protein QM767_27460 [Anaeromyxobacter sp.]
MRPGSGRRGVRSRVAARRARLPRQPAGPDAFERVYTAGVSREDAPSAAPERDRLPAAAAARALTFALRGCVLTLDGPPLADGFVVVEGGRVAAVTDQPPAGVAVHPTAGVILPGLIDLHGHPEFNVFSAWEPPKLFASRYRWRDSAIYRKVVREPWTTLAGAHLVPAALRYAEVRALVGGVVAIQGSSSVTDHRESLVRNVDRWISGSTAPAPRSTSSATPSWPPSSRTWRRAAWTRSTSTSRRAAPRTRARSASGRAWSR